MSECSRIRELFPLYLISELEPEELERVRLHLCECSSCGEELEFCRRDMDAVSTRIHGQKEDPGIEVRIKEAVHAELNRRQPVSVRYRWFIPAAAAVLLVGVFLSAFLMPRGPHALWEQELGQFSKGDGGIAVSAGDSLYVVFAEKNTAYAAGVDSETGRLNWRREHPGIRGIAADSSGLYAVEYMRGQAELQSLSPETGEVQWSFSPDRRSALSSALEQSSPALSEKAVLWRWGDTVYAVNRKDGRKLWSFSAEEGAVPEPVLRKGLAYTAAGSTVYALDTETGKPVFSKEVFIGDAAARISAVTGDEHNLYYSITARDSSQDRVLCFDPENRKALWLSYAPSVAHVQIIGGKIIIRGERLYALDRNSGKTIWSVEAVGCSPVTMVKGKLCYFDSSRKDSFVYLNPETGKVKGRYELDGSCTGIAVYGNSGFVIASTGKLYKLSF